MPPFDAAMAKRHKKNMSAKQVRQWCAVATSTYAACVDRGGSSEACEARAIRAANGVTGEPAAQSPQPFATIVAHIAAATTRREWLDGREYLVARVVPIVEAVLNDYMIPAEEIAACLASWSDLPLPIGHPQNEYGDYMSGKSPAMVAQSVGRFFSPTMDGARLVGEAWLDIEKCQRLGGDAAEVLRRVEANEIVEVSTAFYPQTTMQQGVFNGTPYRGVHRNLHPDHLALLPNGIGACHAGMGCGIRAAQAAHACGCVGACTCEEGEDAMEIDADVKQPGKVRQALRTLFAVAYDPEPDVPPPDDEDDTETAAETAPTPQAQAEAPERLTPPAPQPTALKGERMLTKSELITRLVAHTHTAWTDDQAPVLQGLEERMLEQMLAEADRREQEAPLTLKALQSELGTRDQALRAEYDQKLATHVQHLEERQEREHLVGYLVTHHGWAAEEAQALSLTALHQIHRMADPVSYIGQGMPRLNAHAADDNLPDDDPKYD